MLYRGQEITVVNKEGETQYIGKVKSISKTRKVVNLVRETSPSRSRSGTDIVSRFYRDDRGYHGMDKYPTYINNPGSGTFGHILNDRFVEPEQTFHRSVNLMSGKVIEVADGTPIGCDPSSETYWSS